MEKKILIVEDDPDCMTLVSVLLSQAGHQVLKATNALEAVRLAYMELPELILMDISLPALNGVEVMRTIRESSRSKDIRMVALTAFTTGGFREKMLAAGFDGYIPKPIADHKEFLATVAAYLA